MISINPNAGSNPSLKRAAEGEAETPPPSTRPKTTSCVVPMVTRESSEFPATALRKRDWIQCYTEIRPALESLLRTGIYSKADHAELIKETVLNADNKGEICEKEFFEKCDSIISIIYQNVQDYASSLKMTDFKHLSKKKITHYKEFNESVAQLVLIYKKCVYNDIETQIKLQTSYPTVAQFHTKKTQKKASLRFPIQSSTYYVKKDTKEAPSYFDTFFNFIKEREAIFDTQKAKENLKTYFQNLFTCEPPTDIQSFEFIKNQAISLLSIPEEWFDQWIMKMKKDGVYANLQKLLRMFDENNSLDSNLVNPCDKNLSAEEKILGFGKQIEFTSQEFLTWLKFYNKYTLFKDPHIQHSILLIVEKIEKKAKEIEIHSPIYCINILRNCDEIRKVINKPKEKGAYKAVFKDGEISFSEEEKKFLFLRCKILSPHLAQGLQEDFKEQSFTLISKSEFEIFYDALSRGPKAISEENVWILISISNFLLCKIVLYYCLKFLYTCYNYIPKEDNESRLKAFLNLEKNNGHIISTSSFLSDKWKILRGRILNDHLKYCSTAEKVNIRKLILEYEKETKWTWQFLPFAEAISVCRDYKFLNKFKHLDTVFVQLELLNSSMYLHFLSEYKPKKIYIPEVFMETFMFIGNMDTLLHVAQIKELRIGSFGLGREVYYNLIFSQESKKLNICSKQPVLDSSHEKVLRAAFPSAEEIVIEVTEDPEADFELFHMLPAKEKISLPCNSCINF